MSEDHKALDADEAYFAEAGTFAYFSAQSRAATGCLAWISLLRTRPLKQGCPTEEIRQFLHTLPDDVPFRIRQSKLIRAGDGVVTDGGESDPTAHHWAASYLWRAASIIRETIQNVETCGWTTHDQLSAIVSSLPAFDLDRILARMEREREFAKDESTSPKEELPPTRAEKLKQRDERLRELQAQYDTGEKWALLRDIANKDAQLQPLLERPLTNEAIRKALSNPNGSGKRRGK